MTLELLVSAMNKEPLELAEAMKIGSDAVIVNQTDHYDYREIEYQGHQLRFFDMKERGVGLSRNHVLMRAKADIGLFADEDIVYEDGYAQRILQAFREHPSADVLLFNVQASPGRETYHISEFGRVRWYNCGRYSTYSCAVRIESIRRKNITFSLLFGGGARYGCGEDSLFIQECIKKGLKVYKVPVRIGHEEERESTWFAGYNHKYFFDKGVLYRYMYGVMAKPFSLRFLLAHRDVMCGTFSVREAYQIMCEGIREADQ